MKLVSFGPKGQERPGVVSGTRVIDLLIADPSLPPSIRDILAAGMLSRVEKIVAATGGLPPASTFPLDSVRLGPPVTNPSKIICLGLNYKDHAGEQGKKVPKSPLLFSKGPNVLGGDGDSMPYPRCVEQLDYEVELAFVIGKRARHVSPEDAMAFVAGYTVFLDISARDLQRSERQWFRAKSVDGSGPSGPWLVSSVEIEDPHNLDISCDVNGENRQNSNTGQMIFRIDYILHFISQTMTLEPGDIVATGTPSGVGVFSNPPQFLRRGDKIVGRIESLGNLSCEIE